MPDDEEEDRQREEWVNRISPNRKTGDREAADRAKGIAKEHRDGGSRRKDKG